MNIHAGLVAIDGRGILITGPARSGKSSLAISLIRAGAREGIGGTLVADDRVDLESRSGALFGRAPAAISGLMEISGAGLVRLPVLGKARIDLVAALDETSERLPQELFMRFLDIPVRRLFLPVRQAPFAADLVLTFLFAEDVAPQTL